MSSVQIDKLQKKLLADEIEDKILLMIKETPYEIGAKLPVEKQLCELFGVGRSTVREALKSLEGKKILYIKQGSGIYVKSWTPTHLDPLGVMSTKDKLKTAVDLVNVRLMLEPRIASLAAINATKEDLERIKLYADKVEELIDSGDDYLKYDIEFHTAIAKASKNEIVEQLIPMIDTAVMMFVHVTNRQLKKETVNTHRDITNAIIARDAFQAEAAMNMHLLYNRQYIVMLYKAQLEKGMPYSWPEENESSPLIQS